MKIVRLLPFLRDPGLQRDADLGRLALGPAGAGVLRTVFGALFLGHRLLLVQVEDALGLFAVLCVRRSVEDDFFLELDYDFLLFVLPVRVGRVDLGVLYGLQVHGVALAVFRGLLGFELDLFRFLVVRLEAAARLFLDLLEAVQDVQLAPLRALLEQVVSA